MASPAPHTAEAGASPLAVVTPSYRPPAPRPRGPVTSLMRMLARRENNLLSLLPDVAYREMMTSLGMSRRGIVLVNDPALVAQVMDADAALFPKNDLFVGALEGLVGDAMFVSSGERWRSQRRTLEPTFGHMHLGRAFAGMAAAVADARPQLDEAAKSGARFSLDATMTHLTADIITRAIFSTPLHQSTARQVFDAFDVFERGVENVSVRQLLLGAPWAPVPQSQKVREACQTIRKLVGDLLDARISGASPAREDIAGAAIAARDPKTGKGFDREELINEIGVFFLAGHETTASALTWTMFILSQQPHATQRIRDEVAAIAGDAPLQLEQVRKLTFVRNVLKEALRLYPPITFLPRVAAEATTLGGRRIAKGTMVMIAPWSLHRHERLWRNPDRFDPDRFTPEREHELPKGAYIPFGTGPRVCIGAAFATLEATLVVAELVRSYEWKACAPDKVWPLARLTTRPTHQIECQIQPVGRP